MRKDTAVGSGRRSALLAALSLAALAALAAAVPASAAAAPSSAAFAVPGSNGFRLDVASEGGELTAIVSERRPPVTTFSRGGRLRPADPGNGAASIYYAHAGGGGARRIEATLGRLGRIAVAFHPSGAVRVTALGPGAGCGGPARIVRRLGTFTGLVEFRGEGGYTTVRATRARGSVGTPAPHCAALAGASSAGASAAGRRGRVVLRAVNRRAGTSFEARRSGAGVAFLATLRERVDGGLVVLRRAYARAPRTAFSFDAALTAARVRPPAPFTGSARYRDGAAARWRGSLRATFPGVTLPMTGPGFRTELGARR